MKINLGWGKYQAGNVYSPTSDVLLHASVPVVSLAGCKNIFNDFRKSYIVTDANICAGANAKDVCGVSGTMEILI